MLKVECFSTMKSAVQEAQVVSGSVDGICVAVATRCVGPEVSVLLTAPSVFHLFAFCRQNHR